MDNIDIKSIQYEDLGIFLGFIKYPYNIDGNDLYKQVFEPFFEEHKKRISKYDPDAVKEGKRDPYPHVYKPAGYRMFGSSGLAILSLVDDYLFYSRFFSINHIQTVFSEKDKNNNSPIVYYDNYKSVIVSGVAEKSERSLEDAASCTFLQEKGNRFNFIGIIRLKIDYRLLFKDTFYTIRRIKERISELSKCVKGNYSRFDYIVMDCYDNDEMTVLAFADELIPLYNFLGNIRSITNKDIGKNSAEKHVFGKTYLGFGYDLECDGYKNLDDSYRLNCAVETKPGHRDAFYHYIRNNKKIKNDLQIQNMGVNISGGCAIYFSIPLNKIGELENKCNSKKDNKKKDDIIERDVKEIKISLKDYKLESRLREKKSRLSKSHEDFDVDNVNRRGDNDDFVIGESEVKELRNLMKKVGISKMVRDRLLALIEFYNFSCQNILQNVYLKELKPVLVSFKNIIYELYENKGKEGKISTIKDIEGNLNKEISNIEDACYDRLHVHKNNPAPLEYHGGIQQYLTSFDFAYKQLYKFFSPRDNDAVYVTITGADRASSRRSLFNLNIHDIVFPELFALAIWKEVANFALISQRRYDVPANAIIKPNEKQTKEEIEKKEKLRERFEALNAWYDFISNEKEVESVRRKVHQSSNFSGDDDVCVAVVKEIKKDIIEYFIKDYMVFRFALSCNFELLWHFYFKIFLQSTNTYKNLNHIRKKQLIVQLLRLFMVETVYRETSIRNNSDFLDKMENLPFDSLVAAQWVECYKKVRLLTKDIYDALQVYGFSTIVNLNVERLEANIHLMEKVISLEDKQKKPSADVLQITDSILDNRKRSVNEMKENLLDGCVLIEDIKKPTFLIHLFDAYLNAVYELDKKGRDFEDCNIRCLPRNKDGEISNVMKVSDNNWAEIYRHLISIPIDTTGGFFIPSVTTRRQYFCLRTAFYRSMWYYRFMNATSD